MNYENNALIDDLVYNVKETHETMTHKVKESEALSPGEVYFIN